MLEVTYSHLRYLAASKRSDIATIANTFKDVLLIADVGSEEYYDEIIEIDLDTLEPHINGPFTQDLSHPLSTLNQAISESDWPTKIGSNMVGSCTNNSYEDLENVRHFVAQAKAAGISKVRTPFLVTHGSEQIRAAAEAGGILQELHDAGATLLSSFCGPCVGQWDRTDMEKSEKNWVISSYNRNFAGRHCSNPEAHSFITSPELATVFAFSGRLDFNPSTDYTPIDAEASQSHSNTSVISSFRSSPSTVHGTSSSL